jgi:hypothetical protein
MNGICSTFDDVSELLSQFLQVVVEFGCFLHLSRELLEEYGLVNGFRCHFCDIPKLGGDALNLASLDIEDVFAVFEAIHDHIKALVDDFLEFGVQFEVTLGPELGFHLFPPVLTPPLADSTGRNPGQTLNKGGCTGSNPCGNDLNPLFVGPPALLLRSGLSALHAE